MPQRLDPDEFDFDASEPADRPKIGRWVLLAAALIAGVLIYRYVAGGPSSAMADWGHDWDQQVTQSQKAQRPLLVLFTADWCPPCRMLKKEVFADSDVRSTLNSRFVLLKMDLTDASSPSNRVAQEYGVKGIPTLIVFNPHGDQVDRLTGAGPKEQMVQWLDAAYDKAH